MKLLLTSGGICNDSIANALEKLSKKPRNELKIGFVPTAMNVEKGNKDWFLKHFTDLYKFGYNWIDILDISAAGINWKQRLSEVDAVYVGGGNTFHLLNQTRIAGFDIWLQENIENKVYIGASAGSILVTPTIALAGVEPGDENICNLQDLTGLNFVPFEISPHTPTMISHEVNAEYVKTTKNEFYEIDDSTAIQVVDGKVDVISEGEWKKLQ